MLGLGPVMFSTSYKAPFLMTKHSPLSHSQALPSWFSFHILMESSPSPHPSCGTERVPVLGAGKQGLFIYLEESTDFRKLGLGSEEAKGQHRTDMLRYGVEMGDEAIGHLWHKHHARIEDLGHLKPLTSWLADPAQVLGLYSPGF